MFGAVQFGSSRAQPYSRKRRNDQIRLGAALPERANSGRRQDHRLAAGDDGSRRRVGARPGRRRGARPSPDSPVRASARAPRTGTRTQQFAADAQPTSVAGRCCGRRSGEQPARRELLAQRLREPRFGARRAIRIAGAEGRELGRVARKAAWCVGNASLAPALFAAAVVIVRLRLTHHNIVYIEMANMQQGCSTRDVVLPRPTPGRGPGYGRPFEPGQSGNPGNGRPGSRNKATLAAAVLLDGKSEALTRKGVEAALVGDIFAMKLCLERLCRGAANPRSACICHASRRSPTEKCRWRMCCER
jgi:hypothetical protein